MTSDIDLVRDFVNTFNVETGADVIGTPADLEAWLAERTAAPGRVSERDVERVQAVREALRAVLLANNGGPSAAESLGVLDEAGRRAPLRVGFDDAGHAVLAPASSGVDAGIGQILAALARIQAEGHFARFKACAAGDCHWAYFDESRNRSRTWCSMEVCGNRAKARSYRARTAG